MRIKLILFVLFFTLISSGKIFSQDYDPWLNGFGYRKPITITGSTAGAQTNYQVKITVTYDSDMQADFDDIRFTNSDGTSLIDYWRQSYTPSSTADFWVEVPSIPASPSTTTIYMYYGNPSASSASNGTNTFVFFDDYSSDTSSQYDIGRHATDWHGINAYNPYYDSANKRVAYDTGDDRTGGWKPQSLSLENLCAEVTMGVTGSYPFNTTNGLLVRWKSNTEFYGITISGGDYTSPTLVRNGRQTIIASPSSNTYHPFSGTPFTLKVMIWGNEIKGIYNEGEADEVILETTDTNIVGAGQVDVIVAQSTGWFDDFRVRKYVSPEPTTSIGAEDSLVTIAGSATDWSWKVPAVGEKVRSGSATDWEWKTFQDDGTGLTVPRGSATDWTWGP